MGRRTSTSLSADVAVVGAGAAGLFCALTAAREGARVTLVSSAPLAGAASYWAQGGVAAALAPDDSAAGHAADTLAAGRGAARPSAARVLAAESPDRVRELEAMGVHFDRGPRGELALALEGGHSRRRVAHAGGSATGRAITVRLAALATGHERIRVLENTTATALLIDAEGCAGVALRAGARALGLPARGTVLATGGAAALWARTTNPAGAIGTGLTLAHAAGAELADLELVQFHPTALARPGPRDGFLITEAVRGEGATLLAAGGERFVDELAPRDEVALAIDAELRTSGRDHVGLDMRAVDSRRFPNIAEALAEVGLDPASDILPVAPAAHYTMGGIATDLAGGASLPGLFAVGEAACTGLHGANRLASNSLAECLVFGRRAALAATARRPPTPAFRDAQPPPGPQRPAASTRGALWRLAGLRRTPEGLRELERDGFATAQLIARACLARTESRGAHQRSDLAATDPALDAHHSVVDGEGRVRMERWP